MRLPGIEGEPDVHRDEAPDDEAPGEGGRAPWPFQLLEYEMVKVGGQIWYY